MRLRNALDWMAFVLLLVGALSGGAFVTDVNVLDGGFDPIADALDDVVLILIAAAGFYSIAGVLRPRPHDGHA